MAFSFKNSKGQTYFLHATTRVLKSGKNQHLYYFAKTQKAGVFGRSPSRLCCIRKQNWLASSKEESVIYRYHWYCCSPMET